MALAKRPLYSLISKSVSTNSIRQTTSQAPPLDEKGNYYQKLGHKVYDDAKPPGWESAKPFEEIPGPKPLPLIGNLWRLLPGGDFYQLSQIDLLKKLRAQYGDIVYVAGIRKFPMLFTFNPDDFETTFRNEGPWPIRETSESFQYYRKHIRNDVYQGVGGLATSHGEEWFQFRTAVNKLLMQPRIIENYTETMDEVADQLIDNIRYFSETNPRNEMPADFQNELYKWALESVGVVSYNKRIGALGRDLPKQSEGQILVDLAVEMLVLLFQLDHQPSLWKYISTPTWRRYVKVLDRITEINQKFIEECLRNSDPNPDLPEQERSVLERLIKVDRKVAYAMATDMLMAGVDTTGRTLGGALYFLAKRPDKQEKLRAELRANLPKKNTPVTKEILKQSPYLKACLKEVMRMAPIGIGNTRQTVKDTILSGYQVPKGTQIVIGQLPLCYDEKHFKHPDQFIPERWLRTTKDELSYKNVNQFISLPFGFGPRSCIGKRLANLELEVALSKIIRNFKVSWNYPEARFDSVLLYGIIDPLRFEVKEVAE